MEFTNEKLKKDVEEFENIVISKEAKVSQDLRAFEKRLVERKHASNGEALHEESQDPSEFTFC